MRVLVVSNLYPPDVIGGYELGCQQMTAELVRRGHDVSVLTSVPRMPAAPEAGVHRELRLVDWFTRHSRPAVPPQLERWLEVQSSNVDAANVATLLRHVEAHRPDVVYLWNLTLVGGYGLAGALATLQLPVVWHLMDAVPVVAATVGGAPVRSAAGLLARRLRAQYLVCSQGLLDEIVDGSAVVAGGYDLRDRAELAPNWVDPLPPARGRRHFPAADPKLRIMFAGQLAPHKGVDIILEAARLLLARGRSGFSVDLFGAGLDDHYRTRILHLDLGAHVTLRGSRDRELLSEDYWEHDVLLFPTWAREPFAFAPLEAAARGCVPFVSRDSGNAEWGVDGVHLVKISRDPDEVASVIEAILDRRIDLSALARRGRAQIEQSFTVGAVADQVESAFERARELPSVRPGEPHVAYHLARVTERLLQQWAESTP